MRQQEGGGGTGCQGDVDHQLVAVAPKPWCVRRAEDIDIVVGEVVAGDDQRDLALAESPLSQNLLEGASKGRRAELASEDAACGPLQLAGKDLVAVVDIEGSDLRGTETSSEPQGDDAAG